MAECREAVKSALYSMLHDIIPTRMHILHPDHSAIGTYMYPKQVSTWLIAYMEIKYFRYICFKPKSILS